jgi:hypothetical protein
MRKWPLAKEDCNIPSFIPQENRNRDPGGYGLEMLSTSQRVSFFLMIVVAGFASGGICIRCEVGK